jgi:transcriptional regulator GlxA family with amidase domain
VLDEGPFRLARWGGEQREFCLETQSFFSPKNAPFTFGKKALNSGPIGTLSALLMRRVGIYLFDEVEVLDFAGPFEVFSTASRVFCRLNPDSEPPFEVFTLGTSNATIKARGGLMVEPHLSLEEHPQIDVLMIPGGVISAEMEKPSVISWIAAQAKKAELTISICTGAFLIGKAGLLQGKKATTHWEDIADLRVLLPDVEVVEGQRWVDQGSVITSAGISAAIDVSLHAVSRLAGKDLAVRTARQMEYDWRGVP